MTANVRATFLSLLLGVASPLFGGVNAWTNNGPVALVTALAVDPGSGAVYVATPGRIYKSADHGASWTPIGPDFDPQRYITALAVDPTDASTIYAGIEQDGGVVKSSDGGATFAPSRNGLPAYPGAAEIVIDPKNPSTIYLEGNYLYRSEDAGSNWTFLSFPGTADSLAVDPNVPNRVLAGSFRSPHGGVWVSEDAGQNWHAVANPGNTGSPDSNLIFDTSHPGRMYGTFGTTVARSDDGGETWERGDASFGNSGTRLAVDSASGGIVYATDAGQCIVGTGGPPCVDDLSGVYRSDDQGQTWTRLGDQAISGASTVAVDPTGQFVYASSLRSNGVSVFEYPWPSRLPIQPPARRTRTTLGRPEPQNR